MQQLEYLGERKEHGKVFAVFQPPNHDSDAQEIYPEKELADAIARHKASSATRADHHDIRAQDLTDGLVELQTHKLNNGIPLDTPEHPEVAQRRAEPVQLAAITPGVQPVTQEKINARASQVEQQLGQGSNRAGLSEERNRAAGIVADQLGATARLYNTQHNASYTGKIIGMTENYVVQQVAPQVAALHTRAALVDNIRLGDHLKINYREGRAIVRPEVERTIERDQQQGRNQNP